MVNHSYKDTLSKAKILVVGDVMLDRYWFGQVNRISPEAPVPIAKISHREDRAGGAANVARNISSLGGQATLLSVIGQDEAGDTLESLLKENDVNTQLYRDSNISTTVKLRVLSRQQQLLRIDFEEIPTDEILTNKLEIYSKLVSEHDLVILSDYGKGCLRYAEKMIVAARALGKPVLVDPKGSDYSHYKGATLLTPNRMEFQAVAGNWSDEAALTQKAQALRQELQLDALLVTRSEEGMSLYQKDEVLHQPTVARQVFDVSGAGDTVIGTLGLMLAAGYGYEEAISIANRAAGIVVGKLGTAVVSQEELFC
ncbi:D-alpha,beta-D-heptose 7-phosphate 1-kinase [Janthinobacterium sp. 35]|jgi:rfaE bifunctional protein kinase chain/domain|uniref:D-glycero-beta-D-manno-heptose-7-phosphate kinase n=1 Tax=unclassified Janthinobacterium TaxID=2610881 RepID=UPI000C18B605|nr:MULTISPECIES: D-glycero-beta-D-manno-heptose-7-phosphate kinase [unclassified Janthinobacterium]PIG28991.1 D-alpha,beta-D-heptose 7-phosphate 1-kinase [Janthinobacterium sp. 35]PVX38149.1 D-alpha,beta-D-heptose 7-phosphate 1-kinase [Janthinobacterium sp. 78]